VWLVGKEALWLFNPHDIIAGALGLNNWALLRVIMAIDNV
jgi:hypothetical protein